jgi:hypothetical protein
MAPAANSNAPPSDNERPSPKRRQSRTSRATSAFVRLLDTAEASTLRVDLIDSSATGVAISAMIPITVDSRIVISVAGGSGPQRFALGRVVHCAKLGTGRFKIGVDILDQREGNLNTTKIPDAWRHA